MAMIAGVNGFMLVLGKASARLGGQAPGIPARAGRINHEILPENQPAQQRRAHYSRTQRPDKRRQIRPSVNFPPAA
ncbi:MAG: hypothetical protein FJ261_12435 [Planctomycetes bacterium]|nr:hypothetical protein [Planctomycetota bacterium]